MSVDESTEMRPLLCGESTIKENNGSKCAGLCGDRKLGLIEVIPDPHGDKAD
jgi:hypothetical protein